MKIPPEVIDQIRNYDIVSILEGEGLKLKREGAVYKCCCPFHSEKTPGDASHFGFKGTIAPKYTRFWDITKSQ